MRKHIVIFIALILHSAFLWSEDNCDGYLLPPMPTFDEQTDTASVSSYSNWIADDESLVADSLSVGEQNMIRTLQTIDTIQPKTKKEETPLELRVDTIDAKDDATLVELRKNNRKFRMKIDTTRYSDYRPDVDRTLWMALAFPGLGQINNKKYWKLPIVYGGVAGVSYAIGWNAKTYSDYSRAYRDLLDSNPDTKSYEDLVPNGYPESQWESYLEGRQKTFRRYRDLSIIVGVAFYALTVVDAFVDATLANFEVSPDLSMRVKPKLEPQPNTLQPSVNCAVQLNF